MENVQLAKALQNFAVGLKTGVKFYSQVNARNRSGRGFLESIQELASAHGEETLVLVSHREGIWEVLQHFGLRPHKEYCSIHYLWYDHDSKRLGLWDLEELALAI